MRRPYLRFLALSALLLGALQHHALGQAPLPWNGWMQCDAVAVSANYASRQTHTWTLTGGKPTLRGAFEVRDGTWSVTGDGWLDQNGGQTWTINAPVVPAPINTLIRASDGSRLIQSGHAQLRADNALTVAAPSTLTTATAAPSAGGPRTAVTTARLAAATLTVFEWTFPPVEGSAKATTIKDSKQTPFTERLDRMQPTGVTGTATCAWHFSATDKVPPPPVPPALPPAPFLTATAATGNRDAASRGAVLPIDQARANKAAANSPGAPPPTAETAVAPGRAQNAGAADAIAANSGDTLSVVKPTGPAPAEFAVTLPSPVTALVQWKRLRDSGPSSEDVDSTNWHLYRAEGSGNPVELPLPRGDTTIYSQSAFGQNVHSNRQPNEYLDAGIDPRIRYSYRLRAEYPDGTWGEVAATIHVLPPVNPTGFRATVVPPETVKLEWDAMPGAIRYRLDGTTFPNTGHDLTATSFTISPVRGPGSWQIAAIYAGNYADYANRPVARTLEKDIPTHVPAYLSKSAGAGSDAETTAHYAQLCNWADGSEACGTLAGYLLSWGVDGKAISEESAGELVRYNNATDLGVPRETRCVFGSPNPRNASRRQRFLQGSVICYSNSGKTVSLIVMNGEGGRFAVFQVGEADSSGYGGGWAGATLIPSALFDSEGPKHAPHACLACHGGRYDAATKLVQDASLLPIDPSLVQVVGDAAAQEKIRRINALMRQAYSSPAVAAYIDGLYGGMDGSRHKVDAAGTLAIADFVPSGWASQRSLYLDFVKKDCAICHLAGPANLNFLSAGGFLSNKDLVHTAVCKAHSMPHAETAFINFWTRQSGVVFGPGLFAAALGFQSCN